MAPEAFLGSWTYLLNLRYQTLAMGLGNSKRIIKLQTQLESGGREGVEHCRSQPSSSPVQMGGMRLQS